MVATLVDVKVVKLVNRLVAKTEMLWADVTVVARAGVRAENWVDCSDSWLYQK